MSSFYCPNGSEMVKPIEIEFGGKSMTGIVTDIELTRDVADVTAFGDSYRSYRGLADTRFTITGYIDYSEPALKSPPQPITDITRDYLKERDLSYATNTTNIVFSKTPENDPPLSGNAEDHYRDGGAPELMTSKTIKKVNWASKRVTLIGLAPEGDEVAVTYAKTVEEKRELLFDEAYSYLLVAWPGKYSQDIFIVTDVAAVAKELGLKPANGRKFVDSDGEEWVEAE